MEQGDLGSRIIYRYHTTSQRYPSLVSLRYEWSYMKESKTPTMDELEGMVSTYAQHANDLLRLLGAERARNKELNIENSGWLDVYRRLQSENAVLKAEISRLQSLVREPPHDA